MGQLSTVSAQKKKKEIRTSKGKDLRSRNLLVCAGDYKICIVHGYKVSSELTGEVIFLIVFFPVDI